MNISKTTLNSSKPTVSPEISPTVIPFLGRFAGNFKQLGISNNGLNAQL